MKQKLLFSTALVGIFAALPAFAGENYYYSTEENLEITGKVNLSSKDDELGISGNADINISGADTEINIDYSNVGPLSADGHDGGILHEGKEGNINIEGGTITLNGGSAKIERGGYDGGWIYSKSGKALMSADEFTEKTGKCFDDGDFTDEDLTKAGLKREDIDETAYHVSEGDINISGGKITLDGNARISTTYKNDGNINISGGKINANDGDIEANRGNIIISDGILTMGTDADIMAKQGKLTVKGGTINLNSTKDEAASEMFGLNGVEIAGGTINVNSTGEGDGGGLIDTYYCNMGEDDIKANNITKPATSGDVIFSGGTVNIAENGRLNILTEGNIKLTGGEINVNKGGLFYISSGAATIEGPDDDGEYKLSDYKRGTMAVSDSGVLNISGEVYGNLAVNDGGVVNVGESAAVIDGDATFNSGSTLKISVTESGNGSLTADKITGNSGAKLALNVTKNMEIGDSTEVTLLKGEISNNFSDEVSNSRYKVTKDGGKYTITYRNSASDVVADEGGNANNASTAEAWDSMVSSATAEIGKTAQNVAATLRDLSQNNPKKYVDALTAVAPEIAPLVQHTQTETVNQVVGAVSSRLTGGSVFSPRHGISSGDNPFRKVAVWVQGLFNKSKLDDTKKVKGFDADSYGVAFGAENSFENHVKVGVGYAYTDTDVDGFHRDTDIDTHTVILYGEYKPSNWFVNGVATYGWSDYSEKKGIGINADYDVETFGLQAMSGYETAVNGFKLTPEAGLRYVHISQDSYKDSAQQRISGNDSDILTGVVGAKVGKDFTLNNGVVLQPEFRLAATYDLKNDKSSASVTLVNGSTYRVEGEALDRFGVEVGAGITAALNEKVDLSLGYEGKFRDDYQDHTGLINAKYKL